MNKLKKYGPEKKVIFNPGEIVKFDQPRCKIIGVVVLDESYTLPSRSTRGYFNIRTLIKYSYAPYYSSSFNKVGGVGGNFSHSSWNNLVKLTKRQISKLGPQLMLALYE